MSVFLDRALEGEVELSVRKRWDFVLGEWLSSLAVSGGEHLRGAGRDVTSAPGSTASRWGLSLGAAGLGGGLVLQAVSREASAFQHPPGVPRQ